MIKLNLKNPLVFFDIETTGINIAADRIVEISMLKVFPEGSHEIKTLRINPTIPIPAGASKVHGIYDIDVADKPKFAQVAKELYEFIKGCDLAGYNSNRFDVPLLAEEFLRAGVNFDIRGRKMIDVQNIFHKMEQRTLIAAYSFYCKKELNNAHSAEADTKATYEVLLAQLERYKELENDVSYLAGFSTYSEHADLAGRIVYDDHGTEVFNFGKHKGKPVEEVFLKEPSYYKWMMNGDFPNYTKKVITEINERMQAV